MLSLSTDLAGRQSDLGMLLGDEDVARRSDIPYAGELVCFAEALVSRDEKALARAREGLLQVAGEEVLVDAACVAANFQRMVRIADATGIPIDHDRLPLMAPAVDALGLRQFESSRHTPIMGLLERLLAPVRRWMSLRMLKKMDAKVNREQERSRD